MLDARLTNDPGSAGVPPAYGLRTGWLRILALICSATLTLAQPSGVSDPVMGDYEGYWSTQDGKKGRLSAQIRALGDGVYDGFVSIYRARSLVGVLKLNPSSSRGEPVVMDAVAANSPVGGDLLPNIQGKIRITKAKLIGELAGELGEGQMDGQRVLREPLFLGLKAPAGATVLFDGKDTRLWDQAGGQVTRDRTLLTSGGDLRYKGDITSFRLHLEFRTPFQPGARGQERGNSGVYLLGKYEVQILDSFGVYPPLETDCGALFRLKAPTHNMSLPPRQWQTFDLTYRHRTPNKNGAPTITVVHNGRTVISQAELPPEIVAKGTGGADPDGTIVKLQDHGHAVEFRNIWLRPILRAAP